jgi:hypothetical protein
VFDELECPVAGTLVDVVVEVEVVEVGALVAGVVVTGAVVTGVVAGSVVGVAVVGALAVVGASVDGGATVVDVVVCAPARVTPNRSKRPSRAVTMTTPETLRVIAALIGASSPSRTTVRG